MAYTLTSSWAVRAAAGEPVAVVRVENLQAVTGVACDAWGQVDKPQPLLISAEISFAQPFTAAAIQDTLTHETIHYGTLSRAILASLKESTDEVGLHQIVEDIWLYLTGQTLPTGEESPDGNFLLPAEARKEIRFLSITATLPKASLLGSGVSFTVSVASQAKLYSKELTIHKLQVPTLIGMNKNERLAKQFVITTVAFDKLEYFARDFYVEAEASVVKILEESSFETLEALGTHIADTLLRSYNTNPSYKASAPERQLSWQVKVKMEKPTAVLLAECPIVQVSASLD
ncbi:Dihydroneopterin aldolase-domain-containing protein [Cercophora newfieldiana]|uniref:Dihydroneopterin aldolase-domain-containing protein n=1 Tax=Cercophora newfieldiana TaxID=92897 RepID=A0AA39YS81_9PEZI|nr:Dihydroneopterin aldolase-domain-containing protein [Cercophora newfieldiana]